MQRSPRWLAPRRRVATIAARGDQLLFITRCLNSVAGALDGHVNDTAWEAGGRLSRVGRCRAPPGPSPRARGAAHRPRNEALDCRVYARAAVWLAGADRWSNLKWRDLEIQLGLEEPATARVEAPIVAVQRPMVTEQPIAAQQALEPADLGADIRRRVIRRRSRVRY